MYNEWYYKENVGSLHSMFNVGRQSLRALGVAPPIRGGGAGVFWQREIERKMVWQTEVIQKPTATGKRNWSTAN